jgi:hypothetical protein
MIVVLHRFDPNRDWPVVGTHHLDECSQLLNEPLLSVAWDRDFGGEVVAWRSAEMYQSTGIGDDNFATRLLLVAIRQLWFHFVDGRWISDETSAKTLGQLRREHMRVQR